MAGFAHLLIWLCTHFILLFSGIKRNDGVKKRKLGRNPRIPFTQHQVSSLEEKFRHTHYLSSVDVAELSAQLNLTETRVSPPLHHTHPLFK